MTQHFSIEAIQLASQKYKSTAPNPSQSRLKMRDFALAGVMISSFVVLSLMGQSGGNRIY